MGLATWLNIGGLGVDFVGAALLAYDALYGPFVRLQAAERRTRLAIATDRKARDQELLAGPSEPHADERAELKSQISSLRSSIAETREELSHWERHEHRAQSYAVLGMVCLMVGFAFQAVSLLLMSSGD